MFVIDHKLPKYLNKIRDHLCSEFEEYLVTNFVNITKNKRELIRKAVSCFLINSNNTIIKNNKTFGINVATTNYSNKILNNGRDTKRKVSHRYLRSFLDFLQFENYGNLDIGGEYTGHEIINGKLVFDDFTKSRFTLYEKFLNLHKQLVNRDGKNFEGISNVLVLRDTKKKPLEFKTTQKEKSLIKYLNTYNRFTLTIPVKIGDKLLDNQIYKIANENFESGMRSFTVGEYQSLSKKERSKVLIDDQDTVCYDFQGFEPSLAYSINQEIMEKGDPYRVQELIDLGYDEEVCRKLVKKILIICLNTESEAVAKRAANHMISQDFNVKDLHQKGKIPTGIIPVKTFISAILDKHYLIADCFFTAKGISLQAVGAAINDYVLEHLMQNHKILCLQVHDDFRVAKEHEDLLPVIMKKAYEHVLGFSDNCTITKED